MVFDLQRAHRVGCVCCARKAYSLAPQRTISGPGSVDRASEDPWKYEPNAVWQKNDIGSIDRGEEAMMASRLERAAFILSLQFAPLASFSGGANRFLDHTAAAHLVNSY